MYSKENSRIKRRVLSDFDKPKFKKWQFCICIFCTLTAFHFDCLCEARLPHHMVCLTFNYDNIKVFVLHSPFM